MKENLGMPYMGSKRKLAPKLMKYILEQNPNCKYFYDLFGGGGAMSFYALQVPQIKQVFYNELNTGVVELLRKIRLDGVTDDFYNWIDRETFNANKNNSDWFGGLCKVVWSFGNNQSSYLFGKEVEPIKKLAHEYLFANGYDKTAQSRIKLVKQFKADKNIIGRFQLHTLENAEQLEQLEQLQQLQISNLSYADVQITTPIEETVIYLDPPYKNTSTYECEINHDELIQYIQNSPYKIYLSSYEFDSMYECKSFSHRSILSATANNKVTEKLFCNRAEKEFNLFNN